jgi:DNA-binding NtrC family response regulator
MGRNISKHDIGGIMFESIKVLIVEDDFDVSSLLCRCLSSMSFETCKVQTVSSGLEHLDADIMFMDLTLLNGSAELLLDKWVKENKGPVCIVSASVSRDGEGEWFSRGVWNVVGKPFELSTIESLAHRYGQVVLMKRTAGKVVRLQRIVYGLIIVVAALAGKEFIMPLMNLVSSIL